MVSPAWLTGPMAVQPAGVFVWVCRLNGVIVTISPEIEGPYVRVPDHPVSMISRRMGEVT